MKRNNASFHPDSLIAIGYLDPGPGENTASGYIQPLDVKNAISQIYADCMNLTDSDTFDLVEDFVQNQIDQSMSSVLLTGVQNAWTLLDGDDFINDPALKDGFAFTKPAASALTDDDVAALQDAVREYAAEVVRVLLERLREKFTEQINNPLVTTP